MSPHQIDYTVNILKPILINYLKAQLENFYLMNCREITLDKKVLDKFFVDISTVVEFLKDEFKDYPQIDFIESFNEGIEIGIYSISDRRDIHIKVE